jgi:hypothetical protein
VLDAADFPEFRTHSMRKMSPTTAKSRSVTTVIQYSVTHSAVMKITVNFRRLRVTVILLFRSQIHHTFHHSNTVDRGNVTRPDCCYDAGYLPNFLNLKNQLAIVYWLKVKALLARMDFYAAIAILWFNAIFLLQILDLANLRYRPIANIMNYDA